MENKICYKCKINTAIRLLYKFKNNKTHSYCKYCSINYIKDKFECYNNYYKYLKEKHPFINCECGKTISRSYWIKFHVETKYHNNHTAAVLAASATT